MARVDAESSFRLQFWPACRYPRHGGVVLSRFRIRLRQCVLHFPKTGLFDE